jgi:hypothetical protein
MLKATNDSGKLSEVQSISMKPRSLAYLLSLVLVFVSLSSAAEKQRNWQEGTVVSYTQVGGTFAAMLIESGGYVYMVNERVSFKHSKLANVAINGLVKVAVEKRKLFLLDDDSKEYKLEIVEKALMRPKSPQ